MKRIMKILGKRNYENEKGEQENRDFRKEMKNTEEVKSELEACREEKRDRDLVCGRVIEAGAAYDDRENKKKLSDQRYESR